MQIRADPSKPRSEMGVQGSCVDESWRCLGVVRVLAFAEVYEYMSDVAVVLDWRQCNTIVAAVQDK